MSLSSTVAQQLAFLSSKNKNNILLNIREEKKQITSQCEGVLTTEIRLLVECPALYRSQFIGHSAKQALSSATLSE
jgi:hypothetical protein